MHPGDEVRVAWRKSSYSNANTACVEVGMPARESERSIASASTCVEAAVTPDVVAIRDSKLPTDGDFPMLTVPRAEWAGFLAGLTKP